jgi:hypothetical protein
VLKGKVKIVVSVLDDEAFAAERAIAQGLRGSLPREAFLAIEPLTPADGRDILAGLERQAQRGLQPAQRDFIAERFLAAGASPLYLHMAFAIARRWRSNDDPRARGLAGDVTSLIGQFIDELSSVHHHASELVGRALGLLAAGKDGLSESELGAGAVRRTHRATAGFGLGAAQAQSLRVVGGKGRRRRTASAILPPAGWGCGARAVLCARANWVARSAGRLFRCPIERRRPSKGFGPAQSV